MADRLMQFVKTRNGYVNLAHVARIDVERDARHGTLTYSFFDTSGDQVGQATFTDGDSAARGLDIEIEKTGRR
jgi:hypothetical protein